MNSHNFTKRGLRAPFAWVGGKSRLAEEIISRFPKHTTYVEVFGGALSVLYRKIPSKIEVVNDINGELINLHKIIRTRPLSLRDYLETLPRSREFFEHIKRGILKPRNSIERAAFYYYLIALSFGSKGESFAMPKRLKYAVIENLDFERLIREYDGAETLFYLDPPYVGTENYYKTPNSFGLEEHKKLAQILQGIKGKFVLSYNDCELVKELYSGFRVIETEVDYTLNAKARGRRGELIICS